MSTTPSKAKEIYDSDGVYCFDPSNDITNQTPTNNKRRFSIEDSTGRKSTLYDKGFKNILNLKDNKTINITPSVNRTR